MKTYMMRNEIPVKFTNPVNDIRLRANYIRSLNVNPESKNDNEFNVAWVYCSRHAMIHSTGWCSFFNVFKQPLTSPFIGLAREEWFSLEKTWEEYK
jgi:hypothetical protein